MSAPSLKPKCVRSVSNWTKVSKEHKFEKPTFDKEVFMRDLPQYSPKMVELLNKIKEVDALDLQKHGRTFKHFIFSDLKIGGTGAKILASALIANDMTLAYTDKLKLKSDDELLKTKKNNFILLASTSVYGGNIGVTLKKQLLSKYNERPSNVYGELVRFIVMDSGFKEGIDLFDVKYVHIFEPQTSKADQKQVIGRATRTCGQRGLVFHPTQGWPLQVFVYDVNIPNTIKESLLTPEQRQSNIDTLFKLYVETSGMDLRKLVFADELEKASIVGSVDYELNKNVHRFEIEDDTQYNIFDGGADSRSGTPRPSGKEVICGASKCGIFRPNKSVPVATPLLTAAALSLSLKIPNIEKGESVRNHYCKLLKTNPQYCQRVKEANEDPILFIKQNSNAIIAAIKNKDYKGLTPSQRSSFLRMIFSVLPRPTIKRRLKKALEEDKPKTPSPVDSKTPSPVDSKTPSPADSKTPSPADSKTPSPADSKTPSPADSKTPSPDDIIKTVESEITTPPSLVVSPLSRKNNFLKIRHHVRENFMEYSWPKVKLENHCGYGGPELPLNIETAAKQEGGATIMDLTPSQGFVSQYFTPKNSLKGMLLWQSVGTGKTCTAIATASKQFEPEGYTILWVTRTTLKSDIWKNMFDQVCSEDIKKKIEAGISIPEEYSDRMRLLSKSWNVRPMSYKQFFNLVEGKNALYDSLVKINGKDDPLKKTLLIIDEAHKLYGGEDLSSIERPNMNKLHAAIMKSYTVSKEDSVRVLLMTATPITNDPMELLKLLNLMRLPNEQFSEDYNEFAKQFLNAQGQFTKKGKFEFLNQIAGHISFLNRERDARQFSQPYVQMITANMSQPIQGDNVVLKELSDELTILNDKMKTFKDTKSSIKKEMTIHKKQIKDKCKGLKKEARTVCLKEIETEIERMKTKHEDDIAKIAEEEADMKSSKAILKKKISKVKKDSKEDPSQLTTITTRCMSTAKKSKKNTKKSKNSNSESGSDSK